MTSVCCSMLKFLWLHCSHGIISQTSDTGEIISITSDTCETRSLTSDTLRLDSQTILIDL